MTIHVNELSFSHFAPEFTPESAWGKCLTSYLAQIFRKSSSPHTLEHYRADLQRWFSTEPRRLPHLYNREDVMQFINTPGNATGRVGRPIKPQTANNRLTVLASFYHYAASYGVTGPDGHQYPIMPYLTPTAGILYAKRQQSGFSKALSDDELRQFFAAIGTEGQLAKRNRALFLSLFWCARRVSEITNLRWQDLSQTMIVDSTGSSRLAWVYRWKGKGHASIDDAAEYPPIAIAALFAYLEESGRLATMEPTDAVFTALPDYVGRGHYDPKRPLIPQQVWRTAHEYGIKAGLGRKITTHTFRHTSARIAYANGASARDVQQKLRHRNLSTTSVYLETLISTSDNTLDRLHQFANL